MLDVLIPDAPHGDASEQALTESLRAGATVVSEAVYAELAAYFPSIEEMDRFLEETGIPLEPSGGVGAPSGGQDMERLHAPPARFSGVSLL